MNRGSLLNKFIKHIGKSGLKKLSRRRQNQQLEFIYIGYWT